MRNRELAGSYCVTQGPLESKFVTCRVGATSLLTPVVVKARRLQLRITIEAMTDPTPYVYFPGTAREALTFYGDVFECSVRLHTFEEFGRTDGPAMAIAHGFLIGGRVSLFGCDVAGDERALRCEGLMLSLLGSESPTTLRKWFSKLSEGGQILDDLQSRPWGASDGRVIDRYGLQWLVGFEGD